MKYLPIGSADELADTYRSAVLGADAFLRRSGHPCLIDYQLADSHVRPSRFSSFWEVWQTFRELESAAQRLGNDVHPLLKANVAAVVVQLSLPKRSTWEDFELTHHLYGVWPKQLSLDAMADTYVTARGLFHSAYPGATYTPDGVDIARIAATVNMSPETTRQRVLETHEKAAEILLRQQGIPPENVVVEFDDDMERSEWADTTAPGQFRLRFNPTLLSNLFPGELERIVTHGNAHVLHMSRLAKAIERGGVARDAAAEIVLTYGPLTPVCEGFATNAVLFYPHLQQLGPAFTDAAHSKIHAQAVWHNARVTYYSQRCRLVGSEWKRPEGAPLLDLAAGSSDLSIVDENFNLWAPSASSSGKRMASFCDRMRSPRKALEYFVPYELGVVLMRPLALMSPSRNAQLLEHLLNDPTVMAAVLDSMLEQETDFADRYWTDGTLELAFFEPPTAGGRPTTLSPFPPNGDGHWPSARQFLRSHFRSPLDDMGSRLDELVREAGDNDGRLEWLLARETLGRFPMLFAGSRRNHRLPPVRPSLIATGSRRRHVDSQPAIVSSTDVIRNDAPSITDHMKTDDVDVALPARDPASIPSFLGKIEFGHS